MTAKKRAVSTRIPLTTQELERLTADEFVRLRLKLTDDEKSRLREINQTRERLLQLELIRLHEVAKPLVEDLHAAGFPVDSFADLINTRERYDAALPVLAEHLERDYPLYILNVIARSMAVYEAQPWRADFIRLIRNRPPMPEGKHDIFRDGLAVAIGNTINFENVWETIELLRDASLGTSRNLIVHVFSKTKDANVQKALLDLRESEPELRNAISELPWVKKLDRERKKAEQPRQPH